MTELVEEVARVLFCLDGDWCPPEEAFTNATVNYWFACKPSDHGEDRDCWAHCEEKRGQARAAIEAVFDALAEPSGDAVIIGAANMRGCDIEPPCDNECKARHTFQAMLATLRKQALG